jgi:hypothetical protein
MQATIVLAYVQLISSLPQTLNLIEYQIHEKNIRVNYVYTVEF